MSRFLLGLDIGTSACKTALFDRAGSVLASATHEYPVYYPQPGHVEQDPEDWWQAACAGIRACLAQSGIHPADIAGVGIDGQSWSCIPMDQAGRVLARTPIWLDTRASEICTAVLHRADAGRLYEVSLNPFEAQYTTPKILWFRENRPDVYRQTSQFLQSNSFLVYRLTGQFSQDLCQSYGLHVFDTAAGVYDDDLCNLLGLNKAQLPPLFACHQVVGAVTPAAASATGLAVGTPVVAGGLDAACATLGAGVLEPGQTQEQGGQAGGMSLCMDHPIGNQALILSRHVIPGRWLLQGGTVGGGASLRWFAQEFCQPEKKLAAQTGKNWYQLIDELAATVGAGSDGVLFLPYLAGERSPIWDTQAKGVFFGLGFDKTRAHLARAVLEGAAHALHHNLETAAHTGVEASVLHAMGGAANSPVWMQIKADVTGKTMITVASDTATTLGAAMLAGVGTGVYAGFAEAVGLTVRKQKTYVPDAGRHQLYQKYHAIYLKLYEQLKDSMAAISELSASSDSIQGGQT